MDKVEEPGDTNDEETATETGHAETNQKRTDLDKDEQCVVSGKKEVLHSCLKTTSPQPADHRETRVSFGDDMKTACIDDIPITTDALGPVNEEYGRVARPELFGINRRESMAAFESFRQSVKSFDTTMSSIKDDYSNGKNRWRPWKSWSLPRFRLTAYACLSSVAVLTIRLLLDSKPTAYLIHSIIVFLDMVLIHMFTNSLWLSVSGECLTVVFFLAFHFTKEALFELLETTLIAILCSFHLIQSRNKHKIHSQELQTDMKKLRQSSLYLLRNVDAMDQDFRRSLRELDHDPTIDFSMEGNPGGTGGWFAYPDSERYKEHMRVCGENFFEHFLDGSAGVMYTSFLGLIIDELLSYGQDKSY